MIASDTLRDLLRDNPDWDADVRAGRNGEIVRRLNARRIGSAAVWDDLDADTLIGAVAGETLTSEQERRIQTLAIRGHVRATDPGVRSFLTSLPQAARDKLRSAAEREATEAEAAGVVPPGGRVMLDDVRQAVRRIGKAFINASSGRTPDP